MSKWIIAMFMAAGLMFTVGCGDSESDIDADGGNAREELEDGLEAAGDGAEEVAEEAAEGLDGALGRD